MDTQNSLKRLWEESPIASTALTTPLVDQARLILETPASESPGSLTETVYARPPSRSLASLKSGPSEKYAGATSLAWLMLDIKDNIAERSETEPHRLGEHIWEVRNIIDLLIAQGERALPSDRSLPMPPPFAILDAMIEPYFATYNQHFPLWQKEKFIEVADDLRRSPSPERDLAAIICCNNLVLLALGANSLRSSRGRPTQSNYPYQRSSIDFDIIAGFLTNAKQAIKRTHLLLTPSLLNLQALLSLVSSVPRSRSHETRSDWCKLLTKIST